MGNVRCTSCLLVLSLLSCVFGFERVDLSVYEVVHSFGTYNTDHEMYSQVDASPYFLSYQLHDRRGVTLIEYEGRRVIDFQFEIAQVSYACPSSSPCVSDCLTLQIFKLPKGGDTWKRVWERDIDRGLCNDTVRTITLDTSLFTTEDTFMFGWWTADSHSQYMSFATFKAKKQIRYNHLSREQTANFSSSSMTTLFGEPSSTSLFDFLYNLDLYQIACSPRCMNSGTCVQGTCDCSGTGYSGPTCTTPLCPPLGCLHSGVCEAPGFCNCAGTGYYGPSCDEPVCDPACPENMECSDGNTCVCANSNLDRSARCLQCVNVNLEYEVSRCQACLHPNMEILTQCTSCVNEFLDFSTNCQSCKIPLTRSFSSSLCTDCRDGYWGNDCGKWKCFGVPHFHASACHSHGECVQKDKCVCSEGYYDTQCESAYDDDDTLLFTDFVLFDIAIVTLGLVVGCWLFSHNKNKRRLAPREDARRRDEVAVEGGTGSYSRQKSKKKKDEEYYVMPQVVVQ